MVEHIAPALRREVDVGAGAQGRVVKLPARTGQCHRQRGAGRDGAASQLRSRSHEQHGQPEQERAGSDDARGHEPAQRRQQHEAEQQHASDVAGGVHSGASAEQPDLGPRRRRGHDVHREDIGRTDEDGGRHHDQRADEAADGLARGKAACERVVGVGAEVGRDAVPHQRAQGHAQAQAEQGQRQREGGVQTRPQQQAARGLAAHRQAEQEGRDHETEGVDAVARDDRQQVHVDDFEAQREHAADAQCGQCDGARLV